MNIFNIYKTNGLIPFSFNIDVDNTTGNKYLMISPSMVLLKNLIRNIMILAKMAMQ